MANCVGEVSPRPMTNFFLVIPLLLYIGNQVQDLQSLFASTLIRLLTKV